MLYLIVLMMITLTSAQAKSLEERYEEQKAIVDAEIARRQELKVEAAKLEVLAKLSQLESQNIYVSASASNKNKIKLSQEQSQ